MDHLLIDRLHSTLAGLAFARVTHAQGEALAAIRVAAMRESLEALGRFDAQRARNRFLDHFEPANTLALTWLGELAGFVVARQKADGIDLDHLYLLPAQQGRGLGAEVLRALFAVADQAALPVRVGALKGSRSNDFYRRHGFRLTEAAEWDNYYAREPGTPA